MLASVIPWKVPVPVESRRPRSATALFVTALLLFVVGSLVAWQQPPRLFPLKPQTTSEWWLQPLEVNAFQRMPRMGGSLSDVFVVPTTGEVWAVGGVILSRTISSSILRNALKNLNTGFIVHSRDGGRTWEQVLISTKTGIQALNTIFFTADGSHGWAAGDKGTILTTDNGGKTWQLETSGTTENLSGIAFAADGLRGWAVGVNGTILNTSDGGKSWNPQTSISQASLYGITFTADGLRGWAVGDYGTILASVDGGKNWSPQTSTSQGDIYAIEFAADGMRGWAVGRNGTILTTSNGGKSWNSQK